MRPRYFPVLPLAALALLLLAPSQAWAVGELTQGPGRTGCILESRIRTCQEGRGVEGAQAIVTSPDGRHVYIASSNFLGATEGDSASLAIFDRDPFTGSLRQKGGIAGCISRDGSGGTCQRNESLAIATAMSMSPDGRNIYVANGPRGSLTVFERDTRTGVLTERARPDECPDGGPVCPQSRAMSRPKAIATSPDGRNVYVGSREGGVTVFDRDQATGDLTPKSVEEGCIDAASGPGPSCREDRVLASARDIAISPDGENVYVTSSETDAVAVFNRDPATGALTQDSGRAGCISSSGISRFRCQEARALDSARAIATSGDGKSVYVAGAGAITIFDRDRATGDLTQKRGRAGCISGGGSGDGTCRRGRAFSDAPAVPRGSPRIKAVAVSPDGRNLYVTQNYGALAIFDRNPATGALAQKRGTAGCTAQFTIPGCGRGRALRETMDIATSADDKNVYIASVGVAIFNRARK